MAEPTSNTDPAAATPLSITVDRNGNDVVVVVRGEIDLETSGDLGAALADVHIAGQVNVDLGDVEYMDSTGLRALLLAKDEVEAAGGGFRVTATSNIVARLFDITGVNDLMG